jgi:uncharacterized protein (TIGR02996 family)
LSTVHHVAGAGRGPAPDYRTDDWAAFVRGMREHPADDLRRLVAADWLEERGHPDHAGFLRDGVERAAAGLPAAALPKRSAWPRWGLWPATAPRLSSIQNDREPPSSEANSAARYRAVRLACPANIGAGGAVDRSRHVVPARDLAVFVRRGFVATVFCSFAAWAAHGPDLVRFNPVETVVFKSAGAYAPYAPALEFVSSGHFDWVPEHSDGNGRLRVPFRVFDRLLAAAAARKIVASTYEEVSLRPDRPGATNVISFRAAADAAAALSAAAVAAAEYSAGVVR